ncbi:MAG TPA: ATP synthase subunit I [Halothiobacillus sp.]|nr:ATP synthase subunit I [Halothiobacillus sp.]
MNEPLGLAFALVSGILLGAFFFGGLWWTVRQAISSKHPELWFFGSLLLRTSLVILGFYFILGDDWRKLLAGLLGFVAVRLIALRLTRKAEQAAQITREAGHAP